jgi:hypothetical protein
MVVRLRSPRASLSAAVRSVASHTNRGRQVAATQGPIKNAAANAPQIRAIRICKKSVSSVLSPVLARANNAARPYGSVFYIIGIELGKILA